MSADRSTASPSQSGSEPLSDLIANGRALEPLRAASPTAYAAAERFWSSGARAPPCPHACGSWFSSPSTRLRRSCTARASSATSIAPRLPARPTGTSSTSSSRSRGVSNHALYWSLPILMRELQAAGRPADFPLTPAAQKIKDDFIRERGFWNEQRDVIARTMPDYFAALNELSTESWKNGSLSNKERELICIAIDCTITHMYEPGLVIHLRNALKQGATVQEILAVFHLTALTGIRSYVLGAEALFSEAE